MLAWKKKTNNKQTEPFDRELFEDFVGIVRKTANVGSNVTTNAIPVSYKYINVHYTYILYKYKTNDRNDLYIAFELPKCKSNESLDCRIVNISHSAKDAIKFLDELTNDKYV